jgi:hypothetical protein
MTQTNWESGTGSLVGSSFNFNQFDPSLGTLNSISLRLTATYRVDFELVFTAPATLYVASTATTDPSILADPVLVQQLTDGATVTVRGPHGDTTLFGAPGTMLPVDVRSLTESSGTWSSRLPITDPNYIPPDVASISLSRTIDGSDASLLAQFKGTGHVNLPSLADAYSSFYTSSGNGAGMVLTSAGATLSLQYSYTPFSVIPEPPGLILLALGAGLGLTAAGRRRADRARRGIPTS